MVCSSCPDFSFLPSWQTLLCLMLTCDAATAKGHASFGAAFSSCGSCSRCIAGEGCTESSIPCTTLCAVFYMHWLPQNRVALPAWRSLTSSTLFADLKLQHCPAEACKVGLLFWSGSRARGCAYYHLKNLAQRRKALQCCVCSISRLACCRGFPGSGIHTSAIQSSNL